MLKGSIFKTLICILIIFISNTLYFVSIYQRGSSKLEIDNNPFKLVPENIDLIPNTVIKDERKCSSDDSLSQNEVQLFEDKFVQPKNISRVDPILPDYNAISGRPKKDQEQFDEYLIDMRNNTEYFENTQTIKLTLIRIFFVTILRLFL